jgi:hypothetical protein
MKATLRLCCVLFAFTSGLIALFGVGGRLTGGDDPLQTVGFQVCAGKPCFLGLVPGETAWESVRTTLEANQITFQQIDSTFTTKFDILTRHWLIEIISSPQRQHVSQILWVYRDHPLSIGHFVLMYGLPCFTWHNNSNMLIATFRNLNINARSATSSTIRLQSPVYGLSLTTFLPAGCERLANVSE